MRAVAAHLYGDRALVEGVLHDLESSRPAEDEKALLRFVRRLTPEPASITQHDVDMLKLAGWDETSIFYTTNACALFNYYNRFVLGNGVALVSDEAFDQLGARMAKAGYSREQPRASQEEYASHA